MKIVMKLATVALSAGLMVGCATNSDIEKLQSQINALDNKTTQATAEAKRATEAANAASTSADAAAASARDAAYQAEAVNEKLDRMFQKSMQK